ncbi:MAG: TatD family hydrolase [Candidatus Altiarchaeota archaeon]|nr:TatD family hydrolase [Candidatus Altiarchaeota archaeon]
MIDSHTHLQDDLFSEDRTQVLLRAKKAGVSAVINASVDFKDSIKCLEISKLYETIHPVIGLAPYSALDELNNTIQLIKENPKIVGVGEIGLDWHFKKHESQIEPFKKQIELAKELEIPVVVHSRSAGKHCIDILEEMRAEKVLMHAYDGSFKAAKHAWDLGYYFSIPLTVLVKEQKQKLAKEIPEELLLLETDSPVLNPDGGRNEPANLVKSRDFIANLREVSPKRIDQVSEINAKSLFLI